MICLRNVGPAISPWFGATGKPFWLALYDSALGHPSYRYIYKEVWTATLNALDVGVRDSAWIFGR